MPQLVTDCQCHKPQATATTASHKPQVTTAKRKEHRGQGEIRFLLRVNAPTEVRYRPPTRKCDGLVPFNLFNRG
jgi:hypothetical protein